jgi:copper chaperone CopZ
VPLLVLLTASLGIRGASLFAAPSFAKDFAAVSGRPVQTVRFTIRGLRCVDTAQRVAGQLEDVPGVLRYVARAARSEAQVTYDPIVTDPQALRAAIEGPIIDAASGRILFHQFEVVSMEGVRIR